MENMNNPPEPPQEPKIRQAAQALQKKGLMDTDPETLLDIAEEVLSNPYPHLNNDVFGPIARKEVLRKKRKELFKLIGEWCEAMSSVK